MPILWRYLIYHFLKIASLTILAFIAILLTMRLDEIAHFAALGAPLSYIVIFTLFQIPYILPIAIPLSCLISSFILIQQMSRLHELIALRASGLSLRDILTPLLIAASFLSIANLWITSELATYSHLQSSLLKSELRAVNPLLLLNNKHLMRLKGFYFEALGSSVVGESASDTILAFPNKHYGRLNLMVARDLKATPTLFDGQHVTLLTSTPTISNDGFDHLLIENMQSSVTLVEDFSDLLQKKVWTINNDYLQMPLLLARIKDQQVQLTKAIENRENKTQIKVLLTDLNRSYSEVTKRISIALAVFSFTLMGSAFGISISRQKNYTPLYLAIGLSTAYLIAFFIAKGVEHQRVLADLLYLLPHAAIVATSIVVLNRISRGIE
jgi:lipopolysaccharide export system permease protein